MKLEIGDIVRLKSGGPKMVVNDINHNGENIWVIWTENHGGNMKSASISKKICIKLEVDDGTAS